MQDDNNKDDDNLDENPTHTAVDQVAVLDESKDIQRHKDAQDDDGENTILGGQAPSDDLGDDDDESSSVMQIDDELEKVGLKGDGDNGEVHELGEDALNDKNREIDGDDEEDDEDEDLAA